MAKIAVPLCNTLRATSSSLFHTLKSLQGQIGVDALSKNILTRYWSVLILFDIAPLLELSPHQGFILHYFLGQHFSSFFFLLLTGVIEASFDRSIIFHLQMLTDLFLLFLVNHTLFFDRVLVDVDRKIFAGWAWSNLKPIFLGDRNVKDWFILANE